MVWARLHYLLEHFDGKIWRVSSISALPPAFWPRSWLGKSWRLADGGDWILWGGVFP